MLPSNKPGPSHRATENGAGNELPSSCLCVCILKSSAMLWTDEGCCCPVRHSYLLLGMEVPSVYWFMVGESVTQQFSSVWVGIYDWLIYFSTSFIPCRKSGLPYLGKVTAAARVVLPIPSSVCIFLCVFKQRYGIFNIKACNCMQGQYEHCKRACTESWLWEKNPLPHQGIEPASAACQSESLPTEPHPSPILCSGSQYVLPPFPHLWEVYPQCRFQNDSTVGLNYDGPFMFFLVDHGGLPLF